MGAGSASRTTRDRVSMTSLRMASSIGLSVRVFIPASNLEARSEQVRFASSVPPGDRWNGAYSFLTRVPFSNISLCSNASIREEFPVHTRIRHSPLATAEVDTNGLIVADRRPQSSRSAEELRNCRLLRID